ncbi:C6 finger domain protein [Penicillium malachiteum]|uniref:C6 finger domain protein n=1 Tax=Penicillium malachiteum TaxID=1324776 RepID=UPI00254856AF|nr:C6 finger domain protein [Penicillium malachiteum]KAJ5713566.1 C6 finger domain protein [Penicillium malachiteum]
MNTSTPSRPKKTKDKKIFSCHACRRRKLKCDRFDPCGACQSRGEGARCTWEEGQRPERHHCESLETLLGMIVNLSKEVQELKLLNSNMMENFAGRSTEIMHVVDPASMTPEPRSYSYGDLSFDPNSHQGSQLLDPHQWTSFELTALLPASPLLWGLVSHYVRPSQFVLKRISSFASLTGFIDVHQLIADVEEVEKSRQAFDMSQTCEAFRIKISRILACASLAAVDLDVAKIKQLGIENNGVDALIRDLSRKARMLIVPADADTIPTTSSLVTTPSPISNIYNTLDLNSNNMSSSQTPSTQLEIVSIKILLLLTARCFAAPSEYLKIHLDAISSAIDVSLDSANSPDISPAESELRWQLWSTLCIMDWSSSGIYHHGSYFIRPEMLPVLSSPAPVADDSNDTDLERRQQTRHYLEYSLGLAHLARRAEDCILRTGPVSPSQAAALCAELDTFNHNLRFYELLGSTSPPPERVNSPSSNEGVWLARESIKHSARHATNVQKMQLSLDLELIRFKILRHETFYLLHEPSTAAPLRTMCLDACMDACILVLALCRRLRSGADIIDRMPDAFEGDNQPSTGSLRRTLQPASVAALVGQVLLHEFRSVNGIFTRPDQPVGRGQNSFAFSSGFKNSWAGSASVSEQKVSALQWHVNTVLSLLETMHETSLLARYKLGLHVQGM